MKNAPQKKYKYILLNNQDGYHSARKIACFTPKEIACFHVSL